MHIKIERKEKVVVVRLNRPQALNALNNEVMQEITEKLKPLDNDPETGCFIVTGSEKVFAAGADIKEMQPKSFQQMFAENYFAGWEDFYHLRTPKIAAVSGYAFGGGCELAMMCDLIFAAENAQFGQPEIKLGVIPGIGGTQRLTALIGKARAMDLILTGRTIDADEALRYGLVSRVFPTEQLLHKTIEVAHTLSNYSKTALLAARECINVGMEVGMQEGIRYERRVFHSLFSTEEQTEGMLAFIEKRKPNF